MTRPSPLALIGLALCLTTQTFAAEPPGFKKVLVLGNSITLHGPAPQIGWTGNWGMAATAADKDFAHLLAARLTTAAARPELKVKNIADFEREHDTYDPATGLKDELAFEADLVVVAIGENVPALSTDAAKAKYAAAFAALLAEIQKHGRPTIVVRSSFWPDATKDAVMAKACAAAGGTFVDIGKLAADPSNRAGAERKIDHPGVAAHPGDKGMAAIAQAIGDAVKTRADAAKP